MSNVLEAGMQKTYERRQDVQPGGSLTGSRPGKRKSGKTKKCQLSDAFENQVKGSCLLSGKSYKFSEKGMMHQELCF